MALFDDIANPDQYASPVAEQEVGMFDDLQEPLTQPEPEQYDPIKVAEEARADFDKAVKNGFSLDTSESLSIIEKQARLMKALVGEGDIQQQFQTDREGFSRKIAAISAQLPRPRLTPELIHSVKVAQYKEALRANEKAATTPENRTGNVIADAALNRVNFLPNMAKRIHATMASMADNTGIAQWLIRHIGDEDMNAFMEATNQYTAEVRENKPFSAPALSGDTAAVIGMLAKFRVLPGSLSTKMALFPVATAPSEQEENQPLSTTVTERGKAAVHGWATGKTFELLAPFLNSRTSKILTPATIFGGQTYIGTEGDISETIKQTAFGGIMGAMDAGRPIKAVEKAMELVPDLPPDKAAEVVVELQRARKEATDTQEATQDAAWRERGGAEAAEPMADDAGTAATTARNFDPTVRGKASLSSKEVGAEDVDIIGRYKDGTYRVRDMEGREFDLNPKDYKGEFEITGEKQLTPEEIDQERRTAIEIINQAVKDRRTDKGTAMLARMLVTLDPSFDANTALAIMKEARYATLDEIKRSGLPTHDKDGKRNKYEILGSTQRNLKGDIIGTSIQLYRGHNAHTVLHEWLHRAFFRLNPEAQRTYKEYHEKTGDTRPVDEHFAEDGSAFLFSEKFHELAGPIRKLFEHQREGLADLIERIRQIRGATIDPQVMQMYRDAVAAKPKFTVTEKSPQKIRDTAVKKVAERDYDELTHGQLVAAQRTIKKAMADLNAAEELAPILTKVKELTKQRAIDKKAAIADEKEIIESPMYQYALETIPPWTEQFARTWYMGSHYTEAAEFAQGKPHLKGVFEKGTGPVDELTGRSEKTESWDEAIDSIARNQEAMADEVGQGTGAASQERYTFDDFLNLVDLAWAKQKGAKGIANDFVLDRAAKLAPEYDDLHWLITKRDLRRRGYTPEQIKEAETQWNAERDEYANRQSGRISEETETDAQSQVRQELSDQRETEYERLEREAEREERDNDIASADQDLNNWNKFSDEPPRDNELFQMRRKEQEESPEFKKWFGQSKVVDESGKPLVVYHGTTAEFNEFTKTNDALGFHFGTKSAARIAKNSTQKKGKWTVGEYYLKIANPLNIPDLKNWLMFDLARVLKNKGIIPDNVAWTEIRQQARDIASTEYPELVNRLEAGKTAGMTQKEWDATMLEWSKTVDSMERKVIKNYINAAGYDGITYENNYEGGQSWIALEPTQIKSATGNQGTFDPTNPDVRFQMRRRDDKPALWYSKVSRTVESKMGGSMPKEQLVKMLKSAGIKDEELQYSGLLDLPDGKITKQQAQDALAENAIQIEEVTKGEKPSKLPDGWKVERLNAEDAKNMGAKEGDWLLVDDTGGDITIVGNSRMTESQAYDAAIQSARDAGVDETILAAAKPTETKFASYQLEGGKDYRELLMRLPENHKPFKLPDGYSIQPLSGHPQAKFTLVGPDGVGKAIFGDTYEEALINAREIMPERQRMDNVIRLRQISDRLDAIAERGRDNGLVGVGEEVVLPKDRAEYDRLHAEYDKLSEPVPDKEKPFKSPHWDETNVLAHVRFNTRETPSYTTEQARAIGVKLAAAIGTKEENLGNGAPQSGVYKGIITPLEAAQYSHYRGFKNVDTTGAITKTLFIEEIQSDRKVAMETAESQGDLKEVERLRNLMPFADKYYELAFKRMLRYAVDNGYDRIAWTTGEMQAERYDLSKQIDRVRVQLLTSGHLKGNYAVQAYPKNNRGEAIIDDAYPAKELPNVVGKELADRIVKEVGTPREMPDVSEWKARKDPLSDNRWRVIDAEDQYLGDISAETQKDAIVQMAAKMASGYINERTYSDLDLKVGGEGKKALYDNIFVNYVNKYTKQYGGRVGKTEITTGRTATLETIKGTISSDGKTYWVSYEGKKISPDFTKAIDAMNWQDTQKKGLEAVHSLDITPAMQEQLSQPQSMFQMRPAGTKMSAFEYVTKKNAEIAREKLGTDKKAGQEITKLLKRPAEPGELIKESALTANTRQRAIEQGIADDFSELPGYTTREGWMANQARQADEIVLTDTARARRIAMRLENPPGNLMPGSVYKALELKAIAEKDAQTIYELAQSPLAKELSVMGQAIKSVDRGSDFSPIKAIQRVQEVMEKQATRRAGGDINKARTETERGIREAIQKSASKRPTWEEFIKSIECN